MKPPKRTVTSFNTLNAERIVHVWADPQLTTLLYHSLLDPWHLTILSCWLVWQSGSRTPDFIRFAETWCIHWECEIVTGYSVNQTLQSSIFISVFLWFVLSMHLLVNTCFRVWNVWHLRIQDRQILSLQRDIINQERWVGHSGVGRRVLLDPGPLFP